MCDDEGHLYDETQMPAFHLLTGFGIEVAMKSHLRHIGVPDFLGLKDLGHDLAAIATRLDKRGGLLDLRLELLAVTAQLGPAHKNLVMRYTPTGINLSLPNAPRVMEVLDAPVDGLPIRLFFNRPP